jgi:putative permease
MTKKLIMFGVAVMTTLLALLVFWQFRIVVVYVLISLTFAAVIRPLFTRLAGRKIVVRLAWILLYLVALGSFGFFFFLTGKAAIVEVQQLAQNVSPQNSWNLPVWLKGSTFEQTLITQLPPPSKLFEAFTGSRGQLVLPALLDILKGIGGFVTGLILILILSIYWSINQIHFERLWLSLLASTERSRTRGIWRTIEPEIGAYIRGQLIQSLGGGLLLGLGYWLIGSPYPVLLALIGALACLIPVVGVALGVIPALIVGLATSVQIGLFTALCALIILIALGIWVKPRLFNRRWDNPILTIVLLIVMGEAFGLIGLVVAPPLSVVCQILWNRLISHRTVSGAAAKISDLKERQARIWDSIKSMGEPPLHLLTSSMERLSLLIEKAEPILKAALPVESSESLESILVEPKQEEQKGHPKKG